ncbi:hypothetical protein H0X32_04310 [Patescibacteria group bacterium]|nr:hypothetical protein [Patescibacteria group bacterium]
MENQEQTTTVAWPISGSGGEGKTQKLIKAGKHECVLGGIKLVEVQVSALYLKEGQKVGDKESKLIFVFRPIEFQDKLKSDEQCDIAVFVRPSMNDRAKMFKLLSEMTEDGEMPAHALMNAETYQAFAESFIGKKFFVWCKPSDNGKYNTYVRLVPIEGDTFDKDAIPF